MRDIYNRFLAKFPLFFGYWKKYADLEFSIAGTEAAELVGLDARMMWTTEELTVARSTNVVSQALPIPSISGPTTAPSRTKPVTTPKSFESKYGQPFPL